MRESNRTSRMPFAYWLLRFLVFAAGVSLLAAVLLPGRVYDPSPYSRTLQGVLVAATVLVAVSYIAPNRWGVGSVVFWARLSIMIVGLARVALMSIALASAKFGQKHWLLY